MTVNSWDLSLQRAVRSSWDATRFNWHLGFTAFGGPPVHFKIVRVQDGCVSSAKVNNEQFRDKFVVKLRWIDEQLVRTTRRNAPSIC